MFIGLIRFQKLFCFSSRRNAANHIKIDAPDPFLIGRKRGRLNIRSFPAILDTVIDKRHNSFVRCRCRQCFHGRQSFRFHGNQGLSSRRFQSIVLLCLQHGMLRGFDLNGTLRGISGSQLCIDCLFSGNRILVSGWIFYHCRLLWLPNPGSPDKHKQTQRTSCRQSGCHKLSSSRRRRRRYRWQLNFRNGSCFGNQFFCPLSLIPVQRAMQVRIV